MKLQNNWVLNTSKYTFYVNYVYEKFDATNISALASIESKIGLQEKIEKWDPNLTSFLRQKKSIVADAVIAAILKLVPREASSRTSSL